MATTIVAAFIAGFGSLGLGGYPPRTAGAVGAAAATRVVTDMCS